MSLEKPKIPNVLVLGPITPDPKTARSDTLKSPNLEKAVNQHKPHESSRMKAFYNAAPDSLKAQEAARQLAMQYMLMCAHALQQAGTESSRQLWSDRYTQATSELYDTPDPKLARQLWQEQNSGVEVKKPFVEAARLMGEYLDTAYAPVYDELGLDDNIGAIDPSGIADRFEAGLQVLADQYDPAWSDWVVERNEEKDSLSVVASEKKIIVGMHRADIELSKLKGLFSHEVLVHALRAVNGSKNSEALGSGLSGYLDAEEGFGVFVEYAINGEVSEKNIDRYVDIAYALGQIDGTPHTRAELLDHVRTRALARNQNSEKPKSDEVIEKEIYAHVNRIYRGSRGDQHIGIFTKDISYHKGFIEMGRFFEEQINQGYSIADIMNYVMKGKFDPANPAHVTHLNSQIIL